MLSYTCKTAIKAVIYLASQKETGVKVAIKQIAEQIDASEHTVGKVLQSLARQGLINSLKGPAGGFYVTQDQLLQPISNIVEMVEGRQLFRACGLGLSQCSEKHPCPIHHEYKMAREAIEQLFREKRVKDLCDPVNSGLAYIIG